LAEVYIVENEEHFKKISPKNSLPLPRNSQKTGMISLSRDVYSKSKSI